MKEDVFSTRDWLETEKGVGKLDFYRPLGLTLEHSSFRIFKKKSKEKELLSISAKFLFSIREN